MNIGTMIKKLRRERDITQEKFAEYLNLSPQAVSRWENGVAYPDITVLPAIATFFGVSTDLLLGVDEDRRQETIRNYLEEHKRLSASGKKNECLQLMKEAKTRFPGSFEILIRYGWDLLASAYEAPDGRCVMSAEELSACQQEVVSICRNILEDCTADEIRYDAINLLSQTYMEMNDMEKAVATAERLPGYDNTRNMALYRVYDYDTQEHRAFHQESMQELIGLLWLHIRSAIWGQTDPVVKEALCRKALTLYGVLYENEDYGYEQVLVAQIYEQLVVACLEQKNEAGALEATENAVRHRLAFAETPSGFRHTSVLFDQLTFSHEDLSRNYTCSEAELLLYNLDQPIYDLIRNTPQFAAIQQLVREALKK